MPSGGLVWRSLSSFCNLLAKRAAISVCLSVCLTLSTDRPMYYSDHKDVVLLVDVCAIDQPTNQPTNQPIIQLMSLFDIMRYRMASHTRARSRATDTSCVLETLYLCTHAHSHTHKLLTCALTDSLTLVRTRMKWLMVELLVPWGERENERMNE